MAMCYTVLLCMTLCAMNCCLHDAWLHRRVRCAQPVLQVSTSNGERDVQAIAAESVCCVRTTPGDVLRLHLLDAADDRSVADAELDLRKLRARHHEAEAAISTMTTTVKLYAGQDCVGQMQLQVEATVIDAALELLTDPEMLAGFAFERPWMEDIDLHRLRETKIQQ